MEYGIISCQDLSGKSEEPLPFREVCQICQELASYSMVLAVIPYYQGHICGEHIAVNAILAQAADGLDTILFYSCHQNHLLEVIHRSKLLKLLVGNISP